MPSDDETHDAAHSHGLFLFAQSTLPLLLESVDSSPHPPSLIVTGATASIRGSAKFANFAAGKFAARAITQSLAREFGPRGVHVAHAIIDGGIDIPRLAEYKHKFNNGAPDGLISPDSVSRRLCADEADRGRGPGLLTSWMRSRRTTGTCTRSIGRLSPRSWT